MSQDPAHTTAHERQDEHEPIRFDMVGPDEPLHWWSRLFGVDDRRAHVSISGRELVARFGPWLVESDVANIRHVEITGPYRWWRVAGPARYSNADKGLTFATRSDRGVLICFDEPVRGLDPTGHLRHPNLTVTVTDPEGLIAALVVASGRISGG